MRSIFTSLFLAIGILASYGQQEQQSDTISTLQKLNEALENRSVESSSNFQSGFIGEMDKKQLLDGVLVTPNSSVKAQEEAPHLLRFGMPKVYLGPAQEENYSSYAFANDYAYYSNMPLANNMWLNTASTHETLPIVGAERNVSARLNYMPAKWIIFSGGPYATKYNAFNKHGNTFGVGGQMKVFLHERIRLNGYGQYSIYGKNDDMYVPGMFQQTYFGGSLEFKITKHFGIEGGIIRELNPFTGKWQNRTFIAPVFYGN
ncbi:hypothetical protein [Dysgonomonas sp. 520]|uniref:hypothetical protein n=1 Tax=Dysgonomonas sp. 520 TaxID=2302931 RepID=UPI0013CFE84D|nr:hypothetical protein [Dysgonomonas sp. 520]NDW09516.1 hypothetical protein [Dysgonomonas sp. 520]